MSFFETKYSDCFYSVFRISVGVLYFMYGVQKLFGIWGMPGPVEFGTIAWYAGSGELLIGLALVFGVLTRLASFFGVIEMLVAYYIGHASVSGWNPAMNQGGPALLFMFSFIVILAYGARKASLEKTILGKEIF